MTGAPQRKVRRELEGRDKEELARLLGSVPTETKVHRLWTSEAGQAFVQRAQAFQDAGVPVRWIAEALGLDERILRQVIESYRKRQDGRGTGPRRFLPFRQREGTE